MRLLLVLAACSRPPVCPPDLGYATYDRVETPATPELQRLVEQALPSLGIREPAAAAPVAALVQAHARSWVFWSTALRGRPERTRILSELRRVGLPDVFAMIPYGATAYDPEALGPHGERGLWLLPPDVPGLRVEGCRYVEGERGERWVDHCTVDERTDPGRSTSAALARLRVVWEATGHDVLATLRSSAPNAHVVVAQFLAAVCSDASADATRFPRAETAHCSGLDVPSPERVSAAYDPP
ncbi:MAG: hypothetical protein ABMA64_13430 [Myxococcota bacterium]